MTPPHNSSPFDRAGFRQDGATKHAIRIRMLPKNITAEGLKNMLVFAKDCVYTDLLGKDLGDRGFQTAIVQFQSLSAAEEAKGMLDGKLNGTGDANLLVEVIQRTPGGSIHPQGGRSSDPLNLNRQSSRFNGTFQNLERVSPPRATNFVNGDSSHSDAYNGMFPPQSPIGQPLERQRVSGKSVIGEDGVDDETGKLLNDPVAYAKNDMATNSIHLQSQPRRPTLPHIPTAGLGALAISPGVSSPPISGLVSPRGPPVTSPTAFSPPGLNGMGPSNGFPMSPQQYPRTHMPPVNPADQNPPCNTLYVGNLPIDTSEDELKHLFSKQRGYKRLCFRTKSNGPMCFVEFETITHATKALTELYGFVLSNSVKGGIRLSFSKNPLGVRGQHNGVPSPLSPQGPMSGINGYSGMQSFASANGPPPGLSAPPGLSSPVGQMHNGQSPFSPNGSAFNGHMGGPSGNHMSPNGTSSATSVRSPTVASSNGPWNGSNGNYPDYLYGR